MRRMWMLGFCLAMTTLGVERAVAQVPTTPFSSSGLHFSIELPSPCRHMVGATTVEAVCAPDLDPAAGQRVPTALALFFEVDADAAPSDAKPFTEGDFRAELPESVCGASDVTKVQVTDVAVEVQDSRTVLSATVTCPAVSFLELPERQARAVTIVIEEFRYRLMARWPVAATATAKPLADAFFASFRSTAVSK